MLTKEHLLERVGLLLQLVFDFLNSHQPKTTAELTTAITHEGHSFQLGAVERVCNVLRDHELVVQEDNAKGPIYTVAKQDNHQVFQSCKVLLARELNDIPGLHHFLWPTDREHLEGWVLTRTFKPIYSEDVFRQSLGVDPHIVKSVVDDMVTQGHLDRLVWNPKGDWKQRVVSVFERLRHHN